MCQLGRYDEWMAGGGRRAAGIPMAADAGQSCGERACCQHHLAGRCDAVPQTPRPCRRRRIPHPGRVERRASPWSFPSQQPFDARKQPVQRCWLGEEGGGPATVHAVALLAAIPVILNEATTLAGHPWALGLGPA